MRPPMGKTPETERCFQKLFIDFLGPYPRSKSGNVEPVKKFTTDVVTKYLEQKIFHVFGTPETIVSDNGSQFKSSNFSKFLSSFGIRHVFTAVHSPQSNASERVNRSVLSAIRAYLKHDQSNWDEYLSSIACSLRSSIHTSIGTTPYFMAFGQHMVTHGHTYSLLRKLEMLEDRAIKFDRGDNFDIIRDRASKNMEKRRQQNERYLNKRQSGLEVINSPHRVLYVSMSV
ncbi:uncharacterized protein K02A2.6-like [Stomoxys calcitrans]|uniref:uncharacterized protein K02A2.6-like n=1 Tax=Stomoxys calcitrans TaxID=35570 RepID=UPI0027E2BBB3|nr:uncharacterized protein K02A2.6-like [Stomoxys calcitrans]